jgi:hypothetical protein
MVAAKDAESVNHWIEAFWGIATERTNILSDGKCRFKKLRLLFKT